jgi:hypothetical protein
MAPKAGTSAGGRVVTIQGEPEPITVDTSRMAALVVDMQNDFGAKGGMFEQAGHDLSIARSVIAPTARALASMRRAGIRIG